MPDTDTTSAELLPLLPYYVYVLMDPDTMQVFYCGKGTATRVQQHLPEVLRRIANGEELTSAKHLKIQEICARPQEPLEMVVGRFETDAEAFAVEATLIKWIYGFAQLTNAVHGHGCNFIRDKGDLSERIHLDVQAPLRSNDGAYTKNNLEKLDATGAFGLLSNIRDRLTSEGFMARDFSEKSDRPFSPGTSNGWLGLIVRIRHVDFMVGFSKTCMPGVSIANTLFSRSDEAQRQLAAIHAAKGPAFLARESKNMLVHGEGRYRDFSPKPMFSETTLDSLFDLLHEFDRIGNGMDAAGQQQR